MRGPSRQARQEKLEAWERWAGATMAVVAERKREGVVGEVDDDGRMATRALVAAVFGRRWRRVTAVHGDVLFSRLGGSKQRVGREEPGFCDV